MDNNKEKSLDNIINNLLGLMVRNIDNYKLIRLNKKKHMSDEDITKLNVYHNILFIGDHLLENHVDIMNNNQKFCYLELKEIIKAIREEALNKITN